MKERESRFVLFKQWLREYTQLEERPRGDVVSRAKRVERGLPIMNGGHDLDDEYLRDGLSSVLQTLEYSREDEHSCKVPPAGIAFRIDPQNPLYYQRAREGLASLRAAIEYYRDFCGSSRI
jgi:hypothetical protein